MMIKESKKYTKKLYNQYTYRGFVKRVCKQYKDDVYDRIPIEDIPWIQKDPPDFLVQIVESGKVFQGSVIDLGCGVGNYSIYLAKQGFTVTGVDRSHTAIRLARKQAQKQGIVCHFFTLDVIRDLSKFTGKFDFAFDWQLLHHIFPEYRKQYVENVYRLLTSVGSYLSVCFHESDPQFGGSGKYRQTSLGSTLYFSSEQELKELFAPFFNIRDFQIVQSNNGQTPHVMNYVFMKKK